jgi:hypothetical protein
MAPRHCQVCNKEFRDNFALQTHKKTQKHTEREKLQMLMVISEGMDVRALLDFEATTTKPVTKFEGFEIIESKSIYSDKYKTWVKTYRISPVKPKTTVDAVLAKLIEVVKERTGFDTDEGYVMDIVMKNLTGTYNSTGFKREGHLERISALHNKLLELHEERYQDVELHDIEFEFVVVKLITGGKGRKILNLATDIKTKQSINEIKNTDNLCALRAVVVGLTYKDWALLGRLLGRDITTNDVDYIRRGRLLQGTAAKKLLELSEVEMVEKGLALNQFAKIETFLQVQIHVVSAQHMNSIIYKGNVREIKLYLYSDNDHYHNINSMTGLMCYGCYCEICNKGYDHKPHKCKESSNKGCLICGHATEHQAPKSWLLCESCNRFFYNQECFDTHKATKICEEMWKCKQCKAKLCTKNCTQEAHICTEKCKLGKASEREARLDSTSSSKASLECKIKQHICGDWYCRNCKEQVPKGHKCFMKPQLVKAQSEKYMWYDFETDQSSGEHKVNYAYAIDFEGTEHEFFDIDSFCQWALNNEHKGYTFIAHFGKGFDMQFIYKYCIQNTNKPKMITTGTKIMYMHIKSLNLTFIDSFNFIAQPLSEFPKTFGLAELKKGFFPHYFNTEANQNYVGSMPAKELYDYKHMRNEKRIEFLEWYEIHKNSTFDFKKEMHEYCKSDVDILRKACIKFRAEFLEIAIIDPLQYITIAGVCMAIFRSKYLTEDTVAVVEHYKDKFSKQSIRWLEYLMLKEGVLILHALNGSEKVILGTKVDGYCSETNTIYQYHGCFWHGCPTCFDPEMTNNINKKSMKSLNENTVKQTKKYRDAGYKVIELWTCQESRELKKFRTSYPIVTPIDPREALFGGRTEVFKPLVQNSALPRRASLDSAQPIRYYDICSLYPACMFFDDFPIGHPTKIFQPKTFDPDWFGLIKCTIAPPRSLYHPVLPKKINGKLMFTLCYTCAAENNQDSPCAHTANQRELMGTWSTIEVKKAIEKGYIIKDIHEVWHFEKSNSLFAGYVKDFMKIKMEASSNENQTVRDEAASIGIELGEMKKNPGRKAVAKICLNSLWGKFGQRNNMTKSTLVTDIVEFYAYILNEKYDKVTLTLLTEEMVLVNYTYKNEFVEDNTCTNIFLAVYTTSNARLRLYKQLDNIGENSIGCDTDSLWWIDNGTRTFDTGSNLGDWEDEFKDIPGYNRDVHGIKEMVASGPKSYSYKTNIPCTEKIYDAETNEITKRDTTVACCKCKGFISNYTNGLSVNHEAMRSMVTGKQDEIETTDTKFVRDRTGTIKTTEQTKKYTFKSNFNKRVLTDNNTDTKPFGY